MKCPKCGYISFDHNETCPKCNKGLASVRQRLNVCPFPANPPAFLGSLLGESSKEDETINTTSDTQFNILNAELELNGEPGFDKGGLSASTETGEIEIELGSIIEDSDGDLGVVSNTDEKSNETQDSASRIHDPGTDTDELGQGMEIELGKIILPDSDEIVIGDPDTDGEPIEISPLTMKDEYKEDALESGQGQLSSAEIISEELEQREGPDEEGELILSLEDLKDDELGEVDVTIDTVSLHVHFEGASVEG